MYAEKELKMSSTDLHFFNVYETLRLPKSGVFKLRKKYLDSLKNTDNIMRIN